MNLIIGKNQSEKTHKPFQSHRATLIFLPTQLTEHHQRFVPWNDRWRARNRAKSIRHHLLHDSSSSAPKNILNIALNAKREMPRPRRAIDITSQCSTRNFSLFIIFSNPAADRFNVVNCIWAHPMCQRASRSGKNLLLFSRVILCVSWRMRRIDCVN